MVIEILDVRRTFLIASLVLAAVLSTGVRMPAAQEEVDAAAKKLLAANGMFTRGQYKFAAQEYEEFLGKYPRHAETPNARYMLGVCHYRMDEHAKAAELLEEVLKDSRFTHRDEALAVLGHCRTMTKDYPKALAAFEEILGKHPKSEHAEAAAFSRVSLLYLLDKKQACIDACQELLKKYPTDGREGMALYFLGLCQFDLGKWAEATGTLAGLLKRRPNSPYELDATLLIGRSLEEQSRVDQAIPQYQQFLKKAPPTRQTEGGYYLGTALYRSGRYAEAVKELAAATSKADKSPYAGPARMQLGLAELAAGKAGDARRTLEGIVKGDSTRAELARYWLARCDMAEGRFEQAREALDKLAGTKPPPTNADAILFDRAVCAMSLKRYDRGAKEFEEFLGLHPGHRQAPDATYDLAFCLHSLQKYPESQALCEKLAKDPNAPTAGAALELSAENLFLMRKYDAASAAFQGLLKSARDEDRKLRFAFRLGQCAYLTGKNDQAIELLRPIAESDKAAADADLREARLFLGDAQLQAGKFAEAAETLGRFVAVSKTDKPEVRYKLALAQLRGNQAPAAEKTLAELTKAAPDSPWAARALVEYGQVCYNNHEPKKAAEALNKALEARPAAEVEAAALYLLGYVDLDAGRHAEAGKRFARFLEKFPDHELAPQVSFQQAVCLKQGGQPDKAMGLLGAYLKAQPTGKYAAQARHLTGQCLALTGKHAEAVKVLTELARDTTAVSAEVLYDLAWSQRELKDKEAARTYQRLIDQYPASNMAVAAGAELADMLYGDAKYDEAVKLLEKAVARKDSDARTLATARYRLGLCYAKQGRYDQAVSAFQAVLDANAPADLLPSATYQAGAACAMAGKLKEAEARLAGLIAGYPKDDLAPAAWLKLGEVQASAGQYEKSAATYQEFLRKYPKDKFSYLAQFGIGWASENRKEHSEARKWYERVTESHNGVTAARAQFQIGETYFAEGKFDLAARELQKVDIVYDYPEWSAKALYEAGRAFEQLGQTDQARSQYAACVKKCKDSKKDPTAALLSEKRLKELDSAKPK